MAIPHAQPGDLINVRPLADALGSSATKTVFKTPQVEVIRLVLPAGTILKEHKAPGEIIVQCLEGRMHFTSHGETKELQAGDLLFLLPAEPHSVEALENSSFLLTIILSHKVTTG